MSNVPKIRDLGNNLMRVVLAFYFFQRKTICINIGLKFLEKETIFCIIVVDQTKSPLAQSPHSMQLRSVEKHSMK